MIKVAEYFHSLQGEGSTMGVPAVFLRLSNCNLLCDGKWKCDTIDVWKKGKNYRPEYLISQWKKEGIFERLEEGAHLVVTGGEPLLQQVELVKLFKLLPENTYTELETNGTIIPSEDLDFYIDQYNCSPKLSNSGMPFKRRYKEVTLKWFALISRSIFKFVISDGQDLIEMRRDFILNLQIQNKKVYLMPAASSRKELIEKSQMVAEFCKVYGFNYSSRLQLEIWNRAVGV